MNSSKPKDIAGVYLFSISFILIAGLTFLISDEATIMFVIGGLLALAGIIMALVTTWRLLAAVDWLVDERHAAITAKPAKAIPKTEAPALPE